MNANTHSARPHPGLALLAFLLVIACGDGEVQDQLRSDARQPAAAIPAPAFPAVSDSTLTAGAGPDWPTHGGSLMNHRYSPLAQVNRDNVADLVPAWIRSIGIEGTFEATPLVVGNTMYLSTAGGGVLALNAATGEELWDHMPELETVTLCCGPANRGVSAYGNVIYVSSLDAGLSALDARTGELLWNTDLADPGAGYSATMAPLAVNGKVFVGVSGERYGIRGFMVALDARSGEEIWRWHTIPAPDQGGWWGSWQPTDPFGTPLDRDVAAEREDSSATSGSWNVGGGGISTTPAYDRGTDRLFVNVDGPSPLVDGAIRPGDNLHTGSIVALDAGTGERIWSTQYLPHDVWGLSGGSPPFLFDRGDERYVGFAGRTGWIYVFDAEDGRPILRSDNFVPQEGLFTRPPPEDGIRIAPGAHGGNPGTGVAYDPRTGTVFTAGVHQPMVYSADPEQYQRGELWLGGEVRFSPDEEQWGTVTAIDLADGRITWQKRTPHPVYSDVLATGGALVFVGQGRGTLDAFDARDGRLLWQFDTGAGVHGGPITYEVAGVQYVVVPSGGSTRFGTDVGDDLIAFALASRRPAKRGVDYPVADYSRGGAQTAGARGVRQVSRDSVRQPDPGTDAPVPRETGPAGQRR